MKRYFAFAIPIAFIIYVLILLLFHLLFEGYSTFAAKFYQHLLLSFFSGVLYITLFFGFMWFNLKKTLGYIESDSFDEPAYGHKLTEEFETKFNEFNPLNGYIKEHYPVILISDERNAVKFSKPLSWKSWNVGGILYFNPQNGKVKVILIPFMGYSHKADKLLKTEMEKIKVLLKG